MIADFIYWVIQHGGSTAYVNYCNSTVFSPDWLTLSIPIFAQPGTVGSAFSMSAPITKVVKNDAYTAPRAPVPVAPTRPNTSMAANRSSAANLQPVSRTLQHSTAETSTTAPAPPQVNIPAFVEVYALPPPLAVDDLHLMLLFSEIATLTLWGETNQVQV